MARSSKNNDASPLVFSGSSFSDLASSCSFSSVSARRGLPASSALRMSFVLSEWLAQPESAPTVQSASAGSSARGLAQARAWPNVFICRPRSSDDGLGDRRLVLKQDLAGLDLQ